MFAVLAATRFAHFATICLLFGLAAYPCYALYDEQGRPPFRRVLRLCGVIALITGAAEFMAMAGNMGDSWRSAFDPDILGSAITDTRFGRVWIARLLLMILVIGLSARKQSGKDWVLLAASGLLLASVALTGHSAFPGGLTGLAHQLADMVHLLAAGWWIGGLLALLLAADGLGNQTPVILRRFSRIGYVAVFLVIASGLINSVVLVAPPSALLTSTYGRVLLVKIVLVGAMGLLALSNRLQVTPALAAGADPARWMARLRAQITVEFALAVLILAVVGALGALPPPISQ